MRSMLLRFGAALICLLLIAQPVLAVTLEKGSSGSAVTRMQQALNTLGYAVGTDGVFGTQTRNAVKTFQADHQLKVDGKAGSMTQSVLYTLAAQKGQSAAANTAAPAATSVPAQSGTRQAQVYCSDGGKLNLRAGAGSGYRTIDRIPTGDYIIVLEEQGTTLAAGEPYIFETDGSTLTATMSGPHRAVNADANGLVGTYQHITAPAYSEPDDLNYVLALDNSGNTVFKKVGENVTVGAYRAYINIKNAGDYSPASAAPGRKYIRFGIEGTEEEQAVEMIYDDASLRTRKIMQNGHLYILRDGHLFTAQGTQIK